MKIILKSQQFNLIDSAIREHGAGDIARIVLTALEIENLYREYKSGNIVTKHIDDCLRQDSSNPTVGDYIVVQGVRCQYQGE
jgi:hypothetical protein